MKIRLVQKDIHDTSLAPYLDNAVTDDVDLICFGELSTTGCLYAQQDVASVKSVCAMMSEYDMGILLGLPRKTDQGLVNSCLYYYRGELQFYDKINLFTPMNEDQIYVAGKTPGVFDTPHGRLGVAICFDLRFGELFVRLKELGAEMIFVPAAFPRVRITDWKELLVQRAIETGLPVFGINAVGDDDTNEFGGNTMAIAADGTILARADETSTTVVDARLGGEIDL